MIYGVDVSHWQDKMDWKKAWNKGARFAIVKASQGLRYKDPDFEENVNGALEAGFVVGGFHYFENAADGVGQADNFREATLGYDFAIEPSIDAEDKGLADARILTANLQKLVIELVQPELHPHPLMYTRASWFDERVLPWSGWELCGLWAAHWGVEVPTLPYPWAKAKKAWKIHQKRLDPGHLWGAKSKQIDVDVWNDAVFPFPGVIKPETKPEAEVIDLGNGYGEAFGNKEYPFEGATLTVQGKSYRLVKE